MNFELSDEQQQLADSVSKFLSADYAFEKRQEIVRSESGLSDKVWSTFADMGLTALALPEADGGFDGGAMDLMPVMQACGEAHVVEPLLDNIAFGGRLVARLGNEAQRAALLPGLIDGSRRFAFASLEPGRRYASTPTSTTARRSGDGWVLEGTKIAVIGAPQAHTLLISADADGKGASVFAIDASANGVTMAASRTVDGQRCADIRLAGVEVGGDSLLGEPGSAQAAIDEANDFATALLCADAVGAMQFALDTTLEYTRTRKQFGVPISSFQALQHRMVDMLIQLEQARSMAILAAARVDGTTDPEERSRVISAAKVRIADAARHISQESVQLHGGMGMTEELKVSHTFRRLTMIGQRFGDADHHLERYAALA